MDPCVATVQGDRSTRSHVIAFDAADGTERWDDEITGRGHLRVGAGDRRAARSWSASRTDTVRAFDLSDGTERWSTRLNRPMFFTGAPAFTPDAVVVADALGQVYRLDPDTGERAVGLRDQRAGHAEPGRRGRVRRVLVADRRAAASRRSIWSRDCSCGRASRAAVSCGAWRSPPTWSWSACEAGIDPGLVGVRARPRRHARVARVAHRAGPPRTLRRQLPRRRGAAGAAPGPARALAAPHGWDRRSSTTTTMTASELVDEGVEGRRGMTNKQGRSSRGPRRRRAATAIRSPRRLPPRRRGHPRHDVRARAPGLDVDAPRAHGADARRRHRARLAGARCSRPSCSSWSSWLVADRARATRGRSRRSRTSWRSLRSGRASTRSLATGSVRAPGRAVRDHRVPGRRARSCSAFLTAAVVEALEDGRVTRAVHPPGAPRRCPCRSRSASSGSGSSRCRASSARSSGRGSGSCSQVGALVVGHVPVRVRAGDRRRRGPRRCRSPSAGRSGPPGCPAPATSRSRRCTWCRRSP